MSEKTCETCKYWFDFQSPGVRRFDSGYRPCNHPSVGRIGQLPLKTKDDGCMKHEEDLSLLRKAETVDVPDKPSNRRRVMPDGFV